MSAKLIHVVPGCGSARLRDEHRQVCRLVRTNGVADVPGNGIESGKLRISDGCGHYVEITFLDAVNMQLDANIDDDPGIDSVLAMTWEDLFYGTLRAL